MRFEQGRPFVRVKIAMSLDGCSALESGESQWITGREARLDVHRLRAESCAVATGIGTVLADDPLLNVRHEEIVMYGRQPTRVVLDSQLRMPPDARMLAVEGQTLIFQADRKVDRDLVDALIRPGVRVERVGGLAGHVDIISLLDRLAQLEVNELLVEAGPALAGAFMTGNHCDELIVYIAPKILGSTARRAFDVPSPSTLLNSKIWKTFSIDQLGEDLKLVLKSKNSFADK
jgi:diaminohydroxyphosphoribosylaminopyrimidine deaminase/5-amino-6-(5-phosphoribosylamino)uracil reductase